MGWADLTYSVFIHKLNEKGITLDRKVLADLAMNNPESFKALVGLCLFHDNGTHDPDQLIRPESQSQSLHP